SARSPYTTLFRSVRPMGPRPRAVHAHVPRKGPAGVPRELRYRWQADLHGMVDTEAPERFPPRERDAAPGRGARGLGLRGPPGTGGPRLQPGGPRRGAGPDRRGNPAGGPAARDPHGAHGRLRRGPPRPGGAAPVERPAGAGRPRVRAELP